MNKVISWNSNRFDSERLQSCQQTTTKKEPFKDKLIVWLNTDDKNIQEECENTKYYSDANKCVDEISDIADQDIHFILNGFSLSDDEIDNFLSILQPFTNIRRIYVMCSSSSMQYLKKFSKVRHLFTKPSERQMQREIRSYEEQLLFEFSSIDKDAIFTDQTHNKQEARFIYTQLFKQILLATDPIDSDQAEKERVEMIAYCRHIYTQVNNRSALTFLDRYEASRDRSPIWWYTCDGFLYKMLSEACRMQNIERMFAIRGYIRDLHRQIEHLFSPTSAPLLLYRGQQLSAAAFHEMKTKLGGLLSIHSFFSTTLSHELALVFAGTSNDVDSISVLFEITVPTFDAISSPFANIDSVSAFGEAEQEYLFSFGTVFRINAVTHYSTFGDIWLAQLTLTTDNDPELKHITEHMWTHSLRGKKDVTTFARLMLDMGEAQLAQDIYLSLLQEPRAPQDLCFIYHQLGSINQTKGNYDLSLALFDKALTLNRPCTEDNVQSMAATLLGMAEVHGSKGDWTASLQYAQQALTTMNAYSGNEVEKAYCLHAIGTALLEQQEYTEAIGYIRQALDIRCHILPSLHPALAVSYNDLGFAYGRQEQYEEALSAYKTCLAIRHRSLPEDHWAFSITYNNLANTLYWLERDDEALKMSILAVETATRALGADHPTTNICRTTFEGISAAREESKGP